MANTTIDRILRAEHTPQRFLPGGANDYAHVRATVTGELRAAWNIYWTLRDMSRDLFILSDDRAAAAMQQIDALASDVYRQAEEMRIAAGVRRGDCGPL